MINKYSAIILMMIINVTTYSQNKEFTLEEAVMQQYRGFAPNSLRMFQWIPNTDCYSYLETGTKLMKASVKNTTAKEILNINDFNSKLNAEFYWFSDFKWKNENEFWVNNGKKYYSYNIVSNEGVLLHDLEEEADNPHFHSGSEHVAYTIKNNIHVETSKGDKHVVTKYEDGNIVSGQAIARSEFGITEGIFWSTKGNALAFYQKDETEVHDYPLLDNSKTPGELNPIKYPMAGQKSEKAKVGIYNLESKKTIYIGTKEGEENYLTNLAWSPDDKFVILAEVNRAQNHMWLNVFDASNGNYIRTLFEEENDKWVEPEHPAFFPNSNSYNFVWVSERNGFNNLYYYDFNGKLIKQLTNHAFVVKDIIEFSKDRLYYYATGENPLETNVYTVDLTGKSAMVTKSHGTHDAAISSDGKFIHDNFSSHDVANNHWIIGTNGKVVKKLLESPDKLDELKIGEAEISTLKAKDGTTLYTRLIKPSDFDANKKYPVLVYVYGGPHAQLITDSWLDGASLWMYWLAEQDYLVYTVDNRGSGERGFAFESQIHRQLGTVEIEDQMTGVEYLKSLPYVDGERLAVHGWSFGGFMTTSLMLREPGTFTTGVAGGPVTDWKYYEIMYGERYMDQPDENIKGYENASLLTHAGNLEGDLLLIHGTVDPTVVMQHSLTLVQKFVDLGIQMDFFPYPMHEHNVRGKDRVHLMQKVLDYVIEHNQ